ncbi:type II toxin-antitoxin system VapC family toxin [Streptomyces sp. NPDC085639]|uniref:type II toxin-antitoxin system VapC family toxin n=1 Tax=Streptomyces sp. NPDC085639 TaxID=3365734 RepID=UPI0037D493D5
MVAVGEREALAYLALHRRLKSSGTSIDPPDALIAATALANGWTLVSPQHQASGAIRRTPAEPLGVRGVGHRGRNLADHPVMRQINETGTETTERRRPRPVSRSGPSSAR